MNTKRRDLEIVDHYHNALGTEKRVVRFRDLPQPAPDSIVVMEFAPAQEGYDWVYTTVGVSMKPMPDPNASAGHPSGRRMELILHSDRNHEGLVDLILAIAVYPFDHNTFFDPGDLIAGTPGQGVVEGSPLTDILVMHPYPYPPDFETINHSDGSHTQVLWVVPIYHSERMYAREHGSRALEVLFGKTNAPTSSFWRPPVV